MKKPNHSGYYIAQPTAAPAESPENLDANGDPWDSAKHTATKSKDANGLWKLKRARAAKADTDA